MKFFTYLLLLLIVHSNDTIPQESSPNTLWFGYYQEDRASNPEDPMPGMLYLNIPNDGTFEGELFFSYAGCDGTFDAGRISGSVANGKIQGNWQGNVDGKAVGGTYKGAYDNTNNTYKGTYTNAKGKQKIECDEMGGYYVAPKGTWMLQSTSTNADFCCGIDMDPDTGYSQFTWSEVANAAVYRYVIIDKDCLMEKMDLEACMVLFGESSWPDMVFNEGDNQPIRPMIKGRSYIISLYAIGANGEVIKDGNMEFIYE